MRVRIRGTRSNGNLYRWSDQLVWEITPSVPNNNVAPTAHAQSLETNKNTAKVIVLTATDPEGQALSYSISSQPQHGQLSGQAPNVSYTPDAGYIGADNFTFTANDGALNSAPATISITVLQTGGTTNISNPVSSNTISVNGSLGDWANLQSFGLDGNDMNEANAQVDWLEAWMAHDSDNVYLAYRNDGAINTGTWWPWAIYLDTDTNNASGFQVNGATGAEYLFEGGSLWKYTGTGANWSWSYVSGTISSVANNTAEIKVARSMLGNPNKINLLFIGNNSPFSATGIDYYPNNVMTPFQYNMP